ncbi:MAG: fused DSP-PTPase phosphatase/NAD kinase-like protein [Candidatus Acidiferrales bacterium]
MLATVTLLLVSFYPIAHAQEPANPATPLATNDHAIAHKIIVPGVSNFGEVNEKLFRGAQPSNEGLASLLKMGIEVVVDLREGTRADERAAVTKLGMHYVAIPWRCGHPDNETTARFLTVLRENHDKRIFVHCYYGTDRTGMMIAAFRIADENWTAAEARKEMRAYGFSFTHRMMCPGLASYEENFPSAFKTSPDFDKLRPAESAPQQ